MPDCSYQIQRLFHGTVQFPLHEKVVRPMLKRNISIDRRNGGMALRYQDWEVRNEGNVRNCLDVQYPYTILSGISDMVWFLCRRMAD
jgi:hypothetical protein